MDVIILIYVTNNLLRLYYFQPTHLNELREQCRDEVDQLANFSTSKRPSVRNKIASFRKNLFRSIKKVGRKSIKVPKNPMQKERKLKKVRAPSPPRHRSSTATSNSLVSGNIIEGPQNKTKVENVYHQTPRSEEPNYKSQNADVNSQGALHKLSKTSKFQKALNKQIFAA